MTRLWSRFIGIVTCAVLVSSCAARPGLRVAILHVDGFSEDAKVWMPFRVRLEFTNAGSEATAVRYVHVEPDFADFNEAYGMGTPRDLAMPIPLDAGSRATYDAMVTLLNAQQLQPGSHRMIFKVRIETTDDEITAEFPALFEQSTDPAERALRLSPE